MTGMRRGEVLGLRWQDIDVSARRLAVRHTFVSIAYEIKDSTPKTHQARVVDLDPVTIEHLRDHQIRQEAQQEKWGTRLPRERPRLPPRRWFACPPRLLHAGLRCRGPSVRAPPHTAS